MVPSLSARNLECVKIGKDFMVSHGYIKHDFDVDAWARPEFLEQAAEEVLKEEWAAPELEQAAPGRRARGGGHAARVGSGRRTTWRAGPRPRSGRPRFEDRVRRRG